MNTATEKKDIYEQITNQIIEAMEKGASVGRLPWQNVDLSGCNLMPVNAASKKPYRGVNVISLWVTAIEKGYTSGLWGTYKQWQDLDCQVRRGEKSAQVVFWKFLDAEGKETEDEGEETDERRPRAVMARGYSVFNASQVEGFLQTEQAPESGRIENAERFFSNLQADIRHGGNRAFYSPNFDYIQMPTFGQFDDPQSYYAVLSHEATHWTGAKERLNRELAKRFGDEAYAAEELIAELGAAFLCSELSLSNEPRKDHADYIASWLKVLKNDKRAIFTAASKAQKAVDWMREQQNKLQAAA